MSSLDKVKTNRYPTATLLFGIVACASNWELPDLVWYAVLVFWLVVTPLWLDRKWKLSGGWQAYTAGWILMVPFWFAPVSLRSDSDEALPLLAIVSLVQMADVFAYFSGKAFGKHKLVPAISPGKSWEGATGGVSCMATYITLVRGVRWLSSETGWLATVGVGLILTIASVYGGLLESWLKRSTDIRDSSSLLPGHGGVFDRVDSLIVVLSIYVAFVHPF